MDSSRNSAAIPSLAATPSLTDIIGSEDHFGDMDFKLCEPPRESPVFSPRSQATRYLLKLMEEAIHRAMRRLKLQSAGGSRKRPSRPPDRSSARMRSRIETIHIKPDKIGLVIGPGGKPSRESWRNGRRDKYRGRRSVQHLFQQRREPSSEPRRSSLGMTKEITVGDL